MFFVSCPPWRAAVYLLLCGSSLLQHGCVGPAVPKWDGAEYKSIYLSITSSQRPADQKLIRSTHSAVCVAWTPAVPKWDHAGSSFLP
ncbi:hypothetical protein BDP27DRAFT_1343760 [Rhodocollybia butyracea]|uniref:Secreted protein n=1 Tax=Rhodocollybia butyracea TaxID=206335 RepID=A0A9P5P811_9AGAR|nr:hypothetical protein BDP27DRAFT_1343760 [Rhodocollybia butyracea]